MPSRDSDAKVLEQFLRTMAPPAALTATYRHRVVRASLNARSRIDARRRLQQLAAGALVLACAAFLPVCLLAVSLQSLNLRLPDLSAPSALYSAPSADRSRTAFPLGEPGSRSGLSVRPISADSFELSVIRAQLQSRLEVWTAARKSSGW